MNGDRVAVILDISGGNKVNEGEKDEKVAEQPAKPPVYWIDGNILKIIGFYVIILVQISYFNFLKY